MTLKRPVNFKQGDKVIHTPTGDEGIVLVVPTDHAVHDCVIVQFGGRGEGYTIPKAQLRKSE